MWSDRVFGLWVRLYPTNQEIQLYFTFKEFQPTLEIKTMVSWLGGIRETFLQASSHSRPPAAILSGGKEHPLVQGALLIPSLDTRAWARGQQWSFCILES